MLRLLQIELYKLKHSKSSRVLIIIYFALIFLMALLASIEIPLFGTTFHFADSGFFNFPIIWHFNAWVASWLMLFLAIVIVSMMANEYSNKTLKQNLIDGLSKKEFITSKFVTVCLFSLVSSVVLFILTLILGYSFSSINEFEIVIMDMDYILAYFIRLLGFFSFCLFLGILVRRSAFAIGFIVVWFILEWIIYGILFKGSPDTAALIHGYLPLEAMFSIFPEPLTRYSLVKEGLDVMSAGKFVKEYSISWKSVGIVIGWTVIFIYSSYRTLKNRDL